MVGGAEARIGEEVLGRLGLATATVCWTLTVGLGVCAAPAPDWLLLAPKTC